MGHEKIVRLLDTLLPNLLKGLAPDEVSAFSRLGRPATYTDEAKLFREDTDARVLYILESGRINLCFEMPGGRGCENIVHIEQPGATVGFSTIVPPHRYHSSAYCVGETKVIEVHKEPLDALMETNYHLAYILARNVAELVGVRLYQVQGKLSKILGDELIDGW